MADTGPKQVGLALQGGGAHAAFTWGVLDRLLDEVEKGALFITGISGTSGGALNGAACAVGLNQSPRKAKELLAQLWESVGAHSYWHPSFFNFPMAEIDSARRWNVDYNPFVIGQGLLQQVSSPYLTPWMQNPLGSIIEEVIPDFHGINQPNDKAPDLYVSATNVNETALRIFEPWEITVKVLMASACYPTLFEAVQIGDDFYWDGGDMANPALKPLVKKGADDLLTVLINPLTVEHGPPMLSRQIVNRINEVSFGASWVTEVGQIGLINELIRNKVIPDGIPAPDGKTYSEKRFHVIAAPHFMEEIGAASKSTPSREFFLALRSAGREAAHSWVSKNLQYVGEESTFEIEEEIRNRLNGSVTALQSLKSVNGALR